MLKLAFIHLFKSVIFIDDGAQENSHELIQNL
jgi:hypothetical protein